MPEISVEIEVYCSCGNGLCNQTSEGTKYNRPCFTVEPCEKCLESAHDKGYSRALYDTAKALNT